MHRRVALVVVGMVALASMGLAPGEVSDLAPEGVPDRGPVASEPIPRGELEVTATTSRTPSVKTVDGDPSDWIGQPSRIGGTSRLDAGEHVYSDFLYDAFGADDGQDAERLAILGPLQELESRTARADQLFQAAGEQFGAEPPLGAEDHYGDADQRDVADLAEVRWAVQGDQLLLLVRTTVLHDPTRLAMRVVAGDRVIELDADSPGVAVDASGYRNTLEAALPLGEVAAGSDTLEIALVAGTRGEDGAFTPANAAYRDAEPVAGVYNEREQALAFHAGELARFTTTLDLAALRDGATELVTPGPGYHERSFTSSEKISTEEPEEAIRQRYGVYVPTELADPAPVTYWLHYRGGKAHSGAAWTPRLVTQLGEERDNLVVTPHARGTSTWYVTKAHQDVLEVIADVEATFSVDAQRRYLSGYSMGGYGTYLFGLLYPDRFTAGFVQSGAPTQGAWTGEGPDECSLPCFVEANDGDADAQLTYRLLANARHFPIAIDHGSFDELVPVTGIERMALRLRELGYRYRLTVFAGYDHFTQAVVDEWADGAAYLDRFTRPENPRHVTYTVVPALTEALNTVQADGVAFDFRPDGAWWLDGITARDGDPADPSTHATVDAVAEPLAGTEPGLLLPEAGVASPPGHSTPYVRHGQTWFQPVEQEQANRFTAELTNTATVTFDAARMGLDPDAGALGTVATDGPTTVALTGLERPVEVRVDDQAVPGAWRDGQVVIDLAAGEHDIVLATRGG